MLSAFFIIFHFASSPLDFSLFPHVFRSLTIEPGRQVFTLHAVMLQAQVPQNDWLCTQKVVERRRVQLLICSNKMQALVQFCFFFTFSFLATILQAHNKRRSVVQWGGTKKDGEWVPVGSVTLSTVK